VRDIFQIIKNSAGDGDKVQAGTYDDGGASELVIDMTFGSGLLMGENTKTKEPIASSALVVGIRTKDKKVHTFCFLEAEALELALAVMGYMDQRLATREGEDGEPIQ